MFQLSNLYHLSEINETENENFLDFSRKGFFNQVIFIKNFIKFYEVIFIKNHLTFNLEFLW